MLVARSLCKGPRSLRLCTASDAKTAKLYAHATSKCLLSADAGCRGWNHSAHPLKSHWTPAPAGPTWVQGFHPSTGVPPQHPHHTRPIFSSILLVRIKSWRERARCRIMSNVDVDAHGTHKAQQRCAWQVPNPRLPLCLSPGNGAGFRRSDSTSGRGMMELVA